MILDLKLSSASGRSLRIPLVIDEQQVANMLEWIATPADADGLDGVLPDVAPFWIISGLLEGAGAMGALNGKGYVPAPAVDCPDRRRIWPDFQNRRPANECECSRLLQRNQAGQHILRCILV